MNYRGASFGHRVTNGGELSNVQERRYIGSLFEICDEINIRRRQNSQFRDIRYTWFVYSKRLGIKYSCFTTSGGNQ